MDGHRFDELARSLGNGHSRRGVLKGLGVAALGAVGLARPGTAGAANLGNSVCAKWCHDNFTGSAAGHCTADAAKGTGTCYQCGPAAPAGSTQQLCGGACIPACTALDPCHVAGVCDPATGTCTNPPAQEGTVCAPATDPCHTDSTCDASGNCASGGPVNIDDGNPCTIDACDSATGTVTHTPTPGVNCTTDSGAAGSCDPNGSCVADQTCAGITPGTPQCGSDTDCADGQVCQNGGCFTPCSEPCPEDCTLCLCSASIDGAAATCHDLHFGIGGCHHDSECPAGSVCDPNVVNSGGGANICTRPCPTP